MMAELYDYFGVIGLASIAAWLAAIVLLVVSWRSRRRNRLALVALTIAVLGFVLARINSSRISSFQLDRSEEIAAVAAAQTQAERLEGPRFIEEEPAYRQQGKQQRTAGKQRELTEEVAAPVTEAPARKLAEPQLVRANRWDRYNLFAAKLALFVAVLVIIWDYLARFNRTFERYVPLPIAGAWLDHLFPKTRSASLPGETDVPLLLETIVRRGETFLYVSEHNPWSVPALPRLAVGRRAVWSLPLIECAAPVTTAEAEFVADAVWFQRYAVVVSGGTAWLAELRAYLAARVLTKAAARRTVHLVLDVPVAEDELRALLRVCGETNFKVLVRGGETVVEETTV